MNWVSLLVSTFVAAVGGVGVLVFWAAAGGLWSRDDDSAAAVSFWVGVALYILTVVVVYGLARLLP